MNLKTTDMEPKKVKLLDIKPHKVTIEFVDSGRVCQFPKRSFMRRLDMGIFDVVNPSAIPSVL